MGGDESNNLNFVTGTYIDINHFSCYMAIVICMSFGYLTNILSGSFRTNISGWRQRLRQIIKLVGTKTGLIFFLILFMSSALVLSGSRMAICSIIISILFMCSIIFKKMFFRKIFFIFISVSILTLWVGLYPVVNRFSRDSEGMEIEAGMGTCGYAFPINKTIKRQLFNDHSHNLILNTGFSCVIIALAGGVYYLIMVVKLCIRRRDPFVRGITIGCLGVILYVILHSLTGTSLQIPANALHLSIVTGIMHKTITQL